MGDEYQLYIACKKRKFNKVKEIIDRMSTIQLLHFNHSEEELTAMDFIVLNGGPVDILRSLVHKLTDNKQMELNKTLALVDFCPRISDHIKILIEEGADPNYICQSRKLSTEAGTGLIHYRKQPIFIHLMKYQIPCDILQLMLDRGADPNSQSEYGFYALDECGIQVELLLMRYGATKWTNRDIGHRINRVLVVIDMMLYTNHPDWSREIKELMY